MKGALVILLIGISFAELSRVQAGEQVCNVIEDKSPEYRLKRHLFCDYDPNVRPTMDPKNKTVIGIITILEFVEYNVWSSSLDLNVGQHITWRDPHLTWTPSDYGGIDVINVKSSEIWTPGIYVLNSRDGSVTEIPDTNCALTLGGEITCIPAVRYTVSCDSDYTFWPYDRHNCTLQMGIWSHNGDRVDLVTGRFHVFMHIYRSNPQWKIASTRQYSVNAKSKFLTADAFPTVSTSFLVKRPFPDIRRIIMSPAILLAVVTLATLWLRPGSTERLMFSCTNVWGHLVTLQYVNWHLPFTGSTLPNILLFYNNSLILSAVALILTCWLQRLTVWKRQVPPWLSTYVSAVLTSKPGQVLQFSILDSMTSTRLQADVDDDSDLVEPETDKSNWKFIVVIIGWISFFSFLLAYFIMFGIFFQHPVNDDNLYKYF